MQIDAILFDKDGTLFDFQASWARWMDNVIRTLAEGDNGVARAIARALGFDLDACQFEPDSPVIAGTLEDFLPLIAQHVPQLAPQDLHEKLEVMASGASMVPVVPLHPFLTALRADGYVLGVATNASEAEAHAHLNSVGIASLFDHILGSDSGFGAKPDPGMCVAFADIAGIAPEKIVMVGDSLHDLKAGRGAGMQTVGVLTGVAVEADLAPWADVVLPDVGALPEWLSAQAAAASSPAAG